MELQASSIVLRAFYNPSFFHCCQTSHNVPLHSHLFHCLRFRNIITRCNVKHHRADFCLEASLKNETSDGKNQGKENKSNDLWEGSEFVEVIGIGSRKDAIIDFCLNSPLRSNSLRFWDILYKDSENLQLQEKLAKKEITPRIVEVPLTLHSCSKAVILVASAAYGSHITKVIDILKRVKMANGLAVGIVLKPFSFEGRRRQDEVKDLENELQDHTNLCVTVNTNALLEKDLVTLDEALNTANDAVLMAIYAVSILISGNNKKLLHSVANGMKELNVSDVTKILESYKDAKIGFGAGYNMKTSIMRAVYDCPFLGISLKNHGGTVICIVASPVIDKNDVVSFLDTFRQVTDFSGEIALAVVEEHNVVPNQIISTVIALGGTSSKAHEETGIFSRIAKSFPFFFNIFNRNSLLLPLEEMSNSRFSDETPEDLEQELQMLLSNSSNQKSSFSPSERSRAELELAVEPLSDDQYIEGENMFNRDKLLRGDIGPDYQILDDNGAISSRASPMTDNFCILRLPAGVKTLIDMKKSLTISSPSQPEMKNKDDKRNQTHGVQVIDWDALSGAGAEAVNDLNDGRHPVMEGNNSSINKRKGGILTVRAASMLESERDSRKKWNPMVVMKYRGGKYEGRCQGGLPEGKGHLSLDDGSSYDGMWRYGKRSGLGTFYFSNGDVFQGSWRDDVMHGKGWLYYHTGDRLFVNFWKGKPNGEGRFYSQQGEIFFGQFKDGWRHGPFLCINVDGSRRIEVWEEGVLVSHKHLEEGVPPPQLSKY
ncbi:protein ACCUMULATION AND REPLICATION OF CHLOROPLASTS 3, chloroplastic [Impatiens glandulifera]|uniref:protein ACCUMULATION AND REPLICATION OF CHLOROPLASTS 3, chloroplastic n=1 Tax=Impatiens glandulifera TaxID=253017 RepID=UPI001FB06084|nr:protein ACCUMULATION AND REPLICATION OF CHLOROPLASTS 3, chloroplastic [Impatiens glandulifera]